MKRHCCCRNDLLRVVHASAGRRAGGLPNRLHVGSNQHISTRFVSSNLANAGAGPSEQRSSRRILQIAAQAFIFLQAIQQQRGTLVHVLLRFRSRLLGGVSGTLG